MANNSPWSVKGVAPEAREAAKIAARRQGVNVGRWLTQTILAAASEELRSKRTDSVRPQPGNGGQAFSFTGQPAGQPQGAGQMPPNQPPPPPNPPHDAPQQAAHQQAAPPPPPQGAPQYGQPQNPYQQQPQGQHAPHAQQAPQGGPPALTPEAVLASIQKLAQRIEESEQRTSEVLKPIADRVGDLSHQIDEIKSKSGGSTAPVERAMMRLSERLDRIEEGGSGRRASKPSAAPSSSGGGMLGRLFGKD